MRCVYEQQCHSKTLPETPRQYLDTENFQTERIVQSYSRNFTALTTALNLLGNFEVFGKIYQPILPYMDEVTLFPAGGANPVLRATNTLFDPFLVSYSSLRAVMNFIANPASPLIERTYFVDNNALPGAEYENYLLRNRNDFLPARYGPNDLRSDFVKVAKWLDKLPEQYRSWRGTVDYSGKGSEALLVNTTMMSAIPKVNTDLHSSPFLYPTSPQQLQSGYYVSIAR
ncbi:hypothetical protein LSTR_LSTR004266 [Laodelphax striatellus]|uniref:Uncharacterized protein n=1 Tax=Laodelphax striatellus TaxID=195883 RepID=A0A482XAW0_LAOST|nr:hypothetical protein LSTR_LSTR004266 [Laodelphax striatellus]